MEFVYPNIPVSCDCGWVMYPDENNFKNGQKWIAYCRNKDCREYQTRYEILASIPVRRIPARNLRTLPPLPRPESQSPKEVPITKTSP